MQTMRAGEAHDDNLGRGRCLDAMEDPQQVKLSLATGKLRGREDILRRDGFSPEPGGLGSSFLNVSKYKNKDLMTPH